MGLTYKVVYSIGAGQFIIDAVAEAGGGLTRVDNITFSIDDPPAYCEEARGKAVADARKG